MPQSKFTKEEVLAIIRELEEHFFSNDEHATVWLKKEDVLNIFLKDKDEK